MKSILSITFCFLLFSLEAQFNTNLGYNAGDATTTGQNNVMVGVNAGETNNGSGNIFIGSEAGKNEPGSNRLIISNNASLHTIYGDLENRRVAIGTEIFPTDIAFKLAVEGKIIAREYRATQLPAWPDFVFESSYPLMPLEELEDFIKEHSHLPNVPTSSEVEKDGVELATLYATLLQKIEELTLYVIDLEKKNKLQSQQIRQLKEFIELEKANQSFIKE
jgi:hypothetical protein